MKEYVKKKENIVMQVIDVFFIMILCFATLLSTMLMQGKVLVGAGEATEKILYSFSAVTFGSVVLILGVYIIFVYTTSNVELKDMIKFLYGPAEKKEIEAR